VLACCALLLRASTIPLSDAERQYLKQKGEVTMCVDPDWMPYEKIENGRHVGMAHDYITRFEESIGIPVTLVPTRDWSESIAYAKARKCDIFSLAMATPKRQEYMNFTRPYLHIPLVITTRIDELFIVDIKEVLQKRLGVVKGYAFAELLKLKYPKINLVEVDSVGDGLKELREGKLFGFVGSLASVGYRIQNDYIGELKVAGKFDEQWELGIGVRNDDSMLLSLFDRAIAALDDATRQAIVNRWISVKYEHGVDYSLVWKILAVVLLGALFFTYRHYTLIRYNRMLETLSVTDTLTGLYNRVKTDSAIQEQIDRFDRYATPFSVLLLDIDRFKQINDTYGHQVGDAVLVLLAELLGREIRKTDIAGRWGGEEFMVVLPETWLSGALGTAEKIRQSVEADQYDRSYQVTVSIGVAQMLPSDNFTTLIKRADDALYRAKKSGRNRVRHFDAEREEAAFTIAQ